MTRMYQYFRWLSLDISAGAIVLMAFVSHELGVSFMWHEAALLGMSVWLIYTADHLLDVRSEHQIFTLRRQFHKSYFNQIRYVWIIVFGAGVILLFYLPSDLLFSGLAISIFSFIYLALVHARKNVLKEVVVAIIYANGVLLIPLTRASDLQLWHLILTVCLALLALFNLVLFSWFDQSDDQQEGYTSIVHLLGSNRTRQLLIVLFVLLLGGTFILIFLGAPVSFAIFIGASCITYLLMWYCSNWFAERDRYRIVGDGIFLLPLIWLV